MLQSFGYFRWKRYRIRFLNYTFLSGETGGEFHGKVQKVRINRRYFQGLNGPRVVWHEIGCKQDAEMIVPEYNLVCWMLDKTFVLKNLFFQ